MTVALTHVIWPQVVNCCPSLNVLCFFNRQHLQEQERQTWKGFGNVTEERALKDIARCGKEGIPARRQERKETDQDTERLGTFSLKNATNAYAHLHTHVHSL